MMIRLSSLQSLLSISLIVAIVLSSCSTSNDVVSNGLLQKRKYRKGFHHQDMLKRKKSQDAADGEKAIASNPPEKTEKPPQRDLPTEASMALPEAAEDGKLSSTGSGEIVSQSIQEQLKDPVARQRLLSEENVAPKARKQNRKWSEKSKKLGHRAMAIGEGNEGLLSLIAGAANLFMLWPIPLVGLAGGIIAIFFGVKAVRSEEDDQKLMGTIGLVAGILSLLLSIFAHLYYALIILAFASFAV